jgi:CBS domain-containing protein
MAALHVRDLMSSPVTVIAPQTLLPEIERRMCELRVRHVLVTEREHIVGIVTWGDVRQARASSVPRLNTNEPDVLNELPATTLMTRDVVTVSASARLSTAAKLMVDHKIGGLPVMYQGRPVGMVTATDIVRAVVCSLATAAGAKEHDVITDTPLCT